MEIRDFYNSELGYNNTSDHLYRIKVGDNKKFIKYMGEKSIVCGIHYDALHLNPIYNNWFKYSLPKSNKESKQTASIPFHEDLDENEQLGYIVEHIKRYK